jgi:hypothetical protein
MERKEQVKRMLRKANALLEAMRFSVERASPDDVWRYGSYKTFCRQYQDLAQAAIPLIPRDTVLYGFNPDKIPGNMDTIASQQKEYFDSTYASTLMLKALLENEISFADDETLKLMDFLQSRLRTVIFSVPDNELEVQNSVESLIVGRGMQKGSDYDREAGRVKFAGKEFIPDFIFLNLKLCLEVKLVKTVGRSRSIVDEINADIQAYAKTYERQMYLVYDVGVIRDADELKRDFEAAIGVEVVVVKH